MGAEEAWRRPDTTTLVRAAAPLAQVPVPRADGAPAVALVGTAPHVGVPPPVGIPGLVAQIPVTVAADDGRTAAAGRGDVPDVPVAVEGVAGGGREGGRVVPVGRHDPLPLRAAAEGQARAEMGAGTRRATASGEVEEAGPGRPGPTEGPLRVAARDPTATPANGPPIEGR